MAYAAALLLTLVVEAPVWAAGLPPVWSGEPRWPREAVVRAAVAGSLASLATHPLLWTVAVPGLRGTIGGSVVPLIAAEAAVCVVEGLGIAAWSRADRWSCLGVAVVANCASVAVGLLLW